MERLGYYNGTYRPLEEMKIPMNDRASWFGDGVYDAGPCHNYHIFALDEHIDRFFRSAAALEIIMPVSKEELKQLLMNLVLKMDTGNLFVYYQVTRGSGIRKHAFTKGTGNLWITLTPAEISDGHKPIQLITTEDTRFLHCNIKTLNLIPSVMAAQKAEASGCAEAVFYRPGGRVTECAHSNIHILKNGTLYTAPTDNLILPGIARAHLLRACSALDIPFREEAFSLADLFDADEIIVTSSSNLCLHADRIDGTTVGGKDKDLYNRLRKYLLDEFFGKLNIPLKRRITRIASPVRYGNPHVQPLQKHFSGHSFSFPAPGPSLVSPLHDKSSSNSAADMFMMEPPSLPMI